MAGIEDLIELFRGEAPSRSKLDFGINRGTYYTPQKDFARYIAQGGSQSQGRLIGDLFGKVKSLKVPKKLYEELGGSSIVNIRDPKLLKAAKTDILQTIMARIVQSLTQPLEQYDQQIQQSFVRDVDSIVQKLNTSFQQDIKEEAEAESFFMA